MVTCCMSTRSFLCYENYGFGQFITLLFLCFGAFWLGKALLILMCNTVASTTSLVKVHIVIVNTRIIVWTV